MILADLGFLIVRTSRSLALWHSEGRNAQFKHSACEALRPLRLTQQTFHACFRPRPVWIVMAFLAQVLARATMRPALQELLK